MELVIMILDGSSSMMTHKTATIAGFNKFLVEQQANETPTNMTVLTFHGSPGWSSSIVAETPIKILYDNVPVSEVRPLTHETYSTDGNTNLLDAIGFTLTSDQPSDHVTVCILTDGEENASIKYTYDMIKSLVQQREQQGWAFVFLGANIETFDVGNKLGFNAFNTMAYDTNNIDVTLASASRVVNSLKSRNLGDISTAYATSAFTDAERKASVGE